jgi:hypothetical protein
MTRYEIYDLQQDKPECEILESFVALQSKAFLCLGTSVGDPPIRWKNSDRWINRHELFNDDDKNDEIVLNFTEEEFDNFNEDRLIEILELAEYSVEVVE